ncbi:MAG: Na+/H+ antiporter NhaC family protein, partial [Neofamilia sp.]
MKFKIYISIFIIALFASVIYGVKLLYPLLVGLIIFSYDAWEKGFSPREIFKMMVDGISIVQKVIIIFLLIGVITAAWRLSGTIPYLVYHGASLINPNLFYLYTFLLNLGMSMLLGSVNGTATTMGIVLISLARANGSSLVITTGAILSGAMFGDRLSPVSSSINLVAEITETDVIKNRKPMTHSV